MILPTKHADVVVVGGGITGLATALELVRRGVSVTIVEKEPVTGMEGSGRAQGSLRLQGRHPAEFPLARAALDLWRALGVDDEIELIFGGNAYITDRDADIPTLRRLVSESHALGLDSVQLLNPVSTRELIPAARGPFLAAMYSPIDGQTQPSKATAHFFKLAQASGVLFELATRALAVTTRAGHVSGVKTDTGFISADRVVIAAGVWTPYLAATAGVRIPIMPVALSTCETNPMPPLFSQTIRAPTFSARQRPDGRIVIDAGMDTPVWHGISLYDLQFPRIWVPRLAAYMKTVRLYLDVRKITTELRHRSRLSTSIVALGEPGVRADAAGLEKARQSMANVFPAIADARIERTWVGFVDMSPDGLPIIDTTGPSGLSFAAGFSGHGFTLGPAIGRVMAQLALGEHLEHDLRPFRLGRFAEEGIPVPKKMM